MSKSSTATVRETPVASTAVAEAGKLVIRSENLVVETSERVALLDLTERVMAHVRASGIREGQISLSPLHTTCSLIINEFQSALMADMLRFLEDTVARDRYYMHNDPELSDCGRRNTDSHLRAMLLGHTQTLQISGGEVVLGQWQRVLMVELDGPRPRTLRAQVWGVA